MANIKAFKTEFNDIRFINMDLVTSIDINKTSSGGYEVIIRLSGQKIVQIFGFESKEKSGLIGLLDKLGLLDLYDKL